MTARFVQWTLDVRDVGLMEQFWSRALGYRVEHGDDGNAKLYPPDDAAPDVLTVWAADGDVAAEVERLVSLGARRIDIGQTDDPFVVLADPEGNEFCVLRRVPRRV